MAGELSNLAMELLAQERDRQEDEALKARAMERARAALDRPSGIGLRQAGLVALQSKPRRWLRTWPLVAAAVAAAGLAAAGVSTYTNKAQEAAPLLLKVDVPRAPQLAVGGALVGGALVGSAPATNAPLEQPPEPRAAALAPATGDGTHVPSVKQYAMELALLEPARSSIGRGDYGAALAAIAQHRREFPNGQLSEEREALRVRALWGLGQKPAALAAAKVFRKRYPRSGLLSWLKAQSDQTP